MTDKGVKSAIAISEAGSVRDIQVTIRHYTRFFKRFRNYLIAPSNQRVLLQSRILGRRTTFTNKLHSAIAPSP